MAGYEIVSGDWVRQISSGIWRVSRILSGFDEFRYSLNKPKMKSKRSLVFANRLVNDSWKRSFTTECFEMSWVNRVEDEEQQRVGHLLRDNAALRKAFEAYEADPKPVDLIVNLGFGLPATSDQEQFKAVCAEALADPIQRGLTLDDVLELIRAAGYDEFMRKYPTTARLQLVCPDHELRGAEFVMRRYRFLGTT